MSNVEQKANRGRRSRATVKDETRRRLTDAAAQVFMEKGFAGASLEEISKRAGYTRGAFHWHFASKDDLLMAVLEERMTSRIASTDSVVARSGTPLAFNVLQRESATVSPDERRAWGLLLLEFWLHVARRPDLVARGAQLKSRQRDATAGQIRTLFGDRDLPLPAELIASSLIALEDGFALQELLDPEAQPADRLWDVLYLLADVLMSRPSPPEPH